MKQDELAFFNQQLASLLRCGVPLETALRQLSGSMSRGRLRREVESLEADLVRGVTLAKAMEARRFPAFYSSLIQAGAAGQDLPGMLQLLSDYYHKIFGLRTRFQALMVYPLLVLVGATILSFFVGWFLKTTTIPMLFSENVTRWNTFLLYLPGYCLATLALAVLLGLLVPALRRFLSWKLPGFREMHLSQFAFAMELLLRRGQTVPQALQLLEGMEQGSGAGPALARARHAIEQGVARPEQALARGEVFPPLFLWLVGSAGEAVEQGFAQAGEIYRDRAFYRLELALYAALPISVLLLGILLMLQLRTSMALLLSDLASFGS